MATPRNTVKVEVVDGVTIRYIGTTDKAMCPKHKKAMPLANLAAYHASWCSEVNPAAGKRERATFATPADAIRAGLAKRATNQERRASILRNA